MTLMYFINYSTHCNTRVKQTSIGRLIDIYLRTLNSCNRHPFFCHNWYAIFHFLTYVVGKFSVTKNEGWFFIINLHAIFWFPIVFLTLCRWESVPLCDKNWYSIASHNLNNKKLTSILNEALIHCVLFYENKLWYCA